MALEVSGNLSLGTNLFGPTRCIRYEILGSYGAYSLSEAITASASGFTKMSDFYGYTHATIPIVPSSVVTTMGLFIQTTWSDDSSDETGFRIQWSIDGGAYGNTITVAANVTVANFPVSCVNGSTYRARVQSYNAAGNSSYVIGSQATGDGNCPV